MGKFKRTLSKFLAITLAASFLVQPSIPIFAADAGIKDTSVQETGIQDINVQETGIEDIDIQEVVESSENPTDAAKLPISKGKDAAKLPILKGNLVSEPASKAAISAAQTAKVSDEVWFNTGRKNYCVVSKEDFDKELGDTYFEENGSYMIHIPEENPFFPYEVQFTYNGTVTNEWFQTPDDSIEIGGHTFYVSAYFDGSVVTQMSLDVAGDIVTVYPEEKEFTDGDGTELLSLLPLEEIRLEVDLSSYTPAELTMVSLHSIFIGEKALTDTDKVVWTFGEGDHFTIANSGDLINLSYDTRNGSSSRYQMIVGEADQLAANNLRYIITVNVETSGDWLIPTVYMQDNAGTRTNIGVINSYYSDYIYNDSDKVERKLYTYVPFAELEDMEQIYIRLGFNKKVFANPRYKEFRIYEGNYTSPAEAMKGIDITDKICNSDMTQKDAGYPVIKYKEYWFTIITFDKENQVTGCLPFVFLLNSRSNGISDLYIRGETENGFVYIVDKTNITPKNGCRYYTHTLYKEYAADNIYNQKLYYYKNGVTSNSDVTAAYLGLYSSIAEAKAANAAEVSENLFQREGYAADYSQGVYFTIFVGEDEEEKQEVYKVCFQTKTGTKSIYSSKFSSKTAVEFKGLKDQNGNDIPCYSVSNTADSYSEFNYLTILVDENVDLSNLAPVFSCSGGITLYAKGSSSPEVSGKSIHDFSKDPVQYTASAEDGIAARNYWLHIVKPSGQDGNLYINSLTDSNANTRVENQVIYSSREVFLDRYHDFEHNILFINMGLDAIPSLSVELVSDEMELNDYWTLQGKHDLLGFSGILKSSTYGELDNLAKIRIQAKDGISDGTETSGKLMIKSKDSVLMELTLTGVLGDPCIVTKEIPPAVKYVPYGTMIQNNNKYSWNQVAYTIKKGKLPEGMRLKSNGELYGVPLETGEFPITLEATNSSSEFGSSSAELVLVVKDNTNENVYTASDNGYIIEEHIGTEVGTYDYILREKKDQLFVSTGEYGEFIDLWLNGEKLVEGVDYTKDSGSTRITIRSQTFDKKAKSGTNTIAAEFRVGGDENKELKRTAQNFRLDFNGSSGSSGNRGSSSQNDIVPVENEKKTTSTTSTGYSDDSWIKDEIGWWCKNPDGSWLANTWFELPFKGTIGWYYFNKQGYMLTGWLLKNGQWYYLNPISDGTQGMMRIGWQFINGQWCFFDSEGALVMNTWYQIPYKETTKWYYFNDQGYMLTGWLFKNNKWYYLSPTEDDTQGMMYTGWQFINKKWYYLNEEGALITDAWIDDYYINSEGVWVE